MNKRIATFKLLPVLLLLPLIATGCDKADNPIAPSGSVVTVSANPSRIALNGQSTLTITGFRPDGNRLNPGTQVSLSSSLGTLSNSLVEIGADGFATAILRADGREGDATVTAKLTTAASGDAGSTVTVNVGASKPTVLIVAERTEIDPTEPIFVTFFARDENQLPMGAGQVIQVASTLGTLFVNNNEVTSVTTDSAGRAVARFVAGGQAGTAKITAFLANSDVATADITVRDAATQFVFNVDAESVTLNQKINLTVSTRNASGLPARGVFVQFKVGSAITENGRDVTGAVAGTLTPAAATTGVDGLVVSSFTFTDSNIPVGGHFYIAAKVTLRINGQTQEGVQIITFTRI